MKLASVILDIPTQALDTPYTYAVPDYLVLEGSIEIGCCVVVPFGNRRVVGFVIDLFDGEKDSLPGGISLEKLKAIEAVVSKPYFDEEGADCARWMADYYLAPLSSCVRLFTPPGGVPRMVRSREGHWYLEEPKVGVADDRWVKLGPQAASFKPRKNAIKQIQIINALSRGELRAAELTAEFGSISATLKTLADKGVIEIQHRRRMRGVLDGSVDVQRSELKLTSEQKTALEIIDEARRMADGRVVLLDGVTGSGKTEVYLQAIKSVLDKGQTACVLVPEISLTPQTVARFRGRFGDKVAVMHSRMSDGERFDQWDFIRSGEAKVVVGARSALFTPLKNIGLFIIDEEHEGSYKSENSPRYHARDVAIQRARKSGAAVILGSATPSIESLYAVSHDPLWKQVSLTQRANGKPMPAISVIDMAAEFSGGSRSMFSQELAQALEEELSLGHKAVLLLNQRGYASFLLCRDCGFVPTCPSCSISLTYHDRGNALVCHHCGYETKAPARCPECESPYLRKFGAGTQRVEDDLRLLIDSFESITENVPIIRMDADTTKGKGAHQKLLEQFAAEPVAVLLGTQMIAKGLDFDDVTLVGVINADTQLHLPDFRAAERTFDLLEQVAGRAGRAELEGRVMVQTYQAESSAIRTAASYNRNAFLHDELLKRQALSYPPYVKLVNILIWGANENDVSEVAGKFCNQMRQHFLDEGHDRWLILGPSPCVFSKLRNVFRWHILVKAPPDAQISTALLPLVRAQNSYKDVNIAIDVDPFNLL